MGIKTMGIFTVYCAWCNGQNCRSFYDSSEDRLTIGDIAEICENMKLPTDYLRSANVKTSEDYRLPTSYSCSQR